MPCAVHFCVVDQTPTPTKFLKSCEEVGLFQEINPFDKVFKKAVEQQQNEEVCLESVVYMVWQCDIFISACLQCLSVSVIAFLLYDRDKQMLKNAFQWLAKNQSISLFIVCGAYILCQNK